MAGTISLLFLVVGWVFTVGAVIDVEYPQAPNNYSEVILTCNDAFGESLSGTAVFKLDNVPINEKINVMSTGVSNQISFNFTQEQEGVFSCEHDGFEPVTVSLAASPPATALEGDPSRRYIILPPGSSRGIDLVCTIRPGALAERYSVQWTRVEPFLPFGADLYNTTVPVRGGRNLTEYQCEVRINHDGSGSNSKVYSSPKTIVNISVLELSALAENSVEPQTVTEGDPVSLTCTVLRRGTNFNVEWRIRNEENNVLYSCGGGENSIGVNCENKYIKIKGNETVNRTESVLEITDTSGLGVGNYTVECILQQLISQEYREDISFSEAQELVRGQMNSSILTINEGDSMNSGELNVTVNTGTPVPSAFPTDSTPSASSSALIIILPLVFITFTAVLVVGFFVTWKIWKRRCYYKNNANKSTKPERTVYERELPELPSQPPPMSFIEQLKEELGRKNMLYLKHHLQLTKVIGEGESGLVYRGYITGNVCVAVKTGKALISENQRERLLKEVTLMMSFEHPNVMPLVGMCFDGEVPLLIMPLMSNGSVLDYIRNNKEVLYCTEMSSEEQMLAARKKCMDICHQIAKGMSYLAMKRFVHRDLAARNCMIDGFANGVIKVADFGMAEDMYGTNYCNYNAQGREERVPLKWMAPESIEKNQYSESSDVWSYGVTCWEVFTCGRIPYSGVPVMTLLSELHSGQRLDRPTNTACSDTIWSVIKGVWSFDSEERPKFNDIVKETADLLDCDSAYFKL